MTYAITKTKHAALSFFRSVLATAACLAAALPATAQYPERPITIVVPTPPGGPIDRVARVYAQQLQQALGQPVVVDNKAGAAGKIGVQAAMRAPRDGYT